MSEMKMNKNLAGTCIFTAVFIMLACMVVWVILNASFDYATLSFAIILILICVVYIFIIWLEYKATEKFDALIIKINRTLSEEIEREERRREDEKRKKLVLEEGATLYKA